MRLTSKTLVKHKIPVPVYDLTINENNPCFAIKVGDSQVISHNTKRWKAAIHCLTGDTLIKLADKSSVRIDEMYKSGSQYDVISYDIDHQIVASTTEVMLSGYVNELIELTLENGKSIRCTPNHRFLMTNGEYIEAQYITEDTDLVDVIND